MAYLILYIFLDYCGIPGLYVNIFAIYSWSYRRIEKIIAEWLLVVCNSNLVFKTFANTTFNGSNLHIVNIN